MSGAPRSDPETTSRGDAEDETPPVLKRIGFVLGPVLLVAALLSPWPRDLEPEARRTAATALLMAAWWMTEALPIAVTALLPLALFPLLGVLPSARVAPNYTNHLVFLFLGGFMLAAAMERWGLHRRIALRVILAIGTGPSRVVLGFMLATALLSMWISNTATVLMMLPIAMAVVERVTEDATMDGKGGPEIRRAAAVTLGSTLMIGLAYAASIGGLGTLIGTPPNIVFAGIVRQMFPGSPEIRFLQWMLVGLPLVLVLLPAAWVIVLRLAPPVPLSKFRFGKPGRTARDELVRMGSMSAGERTVLVVFLATVVLWVTRSGIRVGDAGIPGWSSLLPHGAFLHDATVVMATSLTLFLLGAPRPSLEEGPPGRVPILDWETVQRRVPWGILLLFGGGFALAAGFLESGLAAWIGRGLGGLGALPLPLLVFTVCLVVTFLTEVTSNTATATLLLPILGSTAVGIGVHPYLLMIPATLSASCAFMLPVATPPNAIVFSSPWVTIPRMAKTGLLMNLFGALLITLLAFTLLPLFLGTGENGLPAWAAPVSAAP